MVTESERVVLEAFAAVDARDDERLKRISHPEASFMWPESLQPSNFRTVQGKVATSWEEVWEPFQPLPEFTTRKMSAQIVASSGTRVTVLWHQRGGQSTRGALGLRSAGFVRGARQTALSCANVLLR